MLESNDSREESTLVIKNDTYEEHIVLTVVFLATNYEISEVDYTGKR